MYYPNHRGASVQREADKLGAPNEPTMVPTRPAPPTSFCSTAPLITQTNPFTTPYSLVTATDSNEWPTLQLIENPPVRRTPSSQQEMVKTVRPKDSPKSQRDDTVKNAQLHLILKHQFSHLKPFRIRKLMAYMVEELLLINSRRRRLILE